MICHTIRVMTCNQHIYGLEVCYQSKLPPVRSLSRWVHNLVFTKNRVLSIRRNLWQSKCYYPQVNICITIWSCQGPTPCIYWPGVGVTKPISSVPLFSIFFQYYHNTSYLLNITFIFDRCRSSSAAVASVKYKCDSNNLRGSFGRSKILLTEKLTNGALVTPTPGHVEVVAPGISKPSTATGLILTYWGWDKKVAIFWTFSDAFIKWKYMNFD